MIYKIYQTTTPLMTVFIRSALVICALVISVTVLSQSETSYARIAILKPNEGKTVDFEAGYIRHLEWRSMDMVWMDPLGQRTTALVYICYVWTFSGRLQ